MSNSIEIVELLAVDLDAVTGGVDPGQGDIPAPTAPLPEKRPESGGSTIVPTVGPQPQPQTPQPHDDSPFIGRLSGRR